MYITKGFHNFSLTNPRILLVYILQTPLLITNPLLQILYKTLFVYAYLSDCLKTVFNKLLEHSHTGMKITYNTFKQYYYIPFLEKWLSIFIHDCIECQRNKHFNMKIQTAPHNLFQNMLHLSTIEFQWTLKGPL